MIIPWTRQLLTGEESSFLGERLQWRWSTVLTLNPYQKNTVAWNTVLTSNPYTNDPSYAQILLPGGSQVKVFNVLLPTALKFVTQFPSISLGFSRRQCSKLLEKFLKDNSGQKSCLLICFSWTVLLQNPSSRIYERQQLVKDSWNLGMHYNHVLKWKQRKISS